MVKFPPFEVGVSIKISKEKQTCWGPGVRELLFLTRQTESLMAASKEMKLSYSKAFGLIKKCESVLGYPILISQQGGKGGGYSLLTEKAHWLLDNYIVLEQEVNLLVKNYFDEHFVEVENIN